MRRWLLHLAHDEHALVGEIQTPTADLTGRGWLVERHLKGSGWALAGPLERTDDGWAVDVVPA